VKQMLLQRLYKAIKSNNRNSCLANLLAIKNAGGSDFVSQQEFPFIALLAFKDIAITSVLAKVYPNLFPGVKPVASPFPFNRSISEDLKFGGSVASVTFDSELFAGTNFDCNESYFNYEAFACSQVDVSLFGISAQAVEAKAIYGRENGVVVGDDMFLDIFGHTIYSENFPVIDCNMHTYPIAHAAPGFSVSYTLWVSIIPVTFSAATDLALDLQWGWEICDSQLLLEVELIPSAVLSICGNAEINLLLLRCGLQLQADFNSDLIPQAKIEGSECSLEFDVDWVSNPMDANFNGYYQWKSCKFLIFDCHWGTHNENVFWSWNEPAHNQIVFEDTWKIASQ